MRIILLEGQPGSGKSTLAENLYDKFKQKNINCLIIDEYKQDTEIFGDYWNDFDKSGDETAKSFIKLWEAFLKNVDKETVIIMDNALLNQIQYLMAINTSTVTIMSFFNEIVSALRNSGAEMIFLDGNSDIIIRRANQVRKNGWGERVAALLEGAPYQIAKNRKGVDGMIEFFSDSQSLKRKVLVNWIYPKVEIDVTNGNWDRCKEKKKKSLGCRG